MKYFKIYNYDYLPIKEERANLLVIQRRKIFAEDYEVGEVDCSINHGILTVKFGKGSISTADWSIIYDIEMEESEKFNFKDFDNP